MGHFGVKKTEDVLSSHFYWLRMHRVGTCSLSQGGQQG
jgi:hypothetical protein